MTKSRGGIIKKIDSVNNKIIIETAKLKQKKYRQNNHRFLVEGYHLIEEAYKANVLKTIFFIDNNPFKDIENYQVNQQIISKLSSVTNNQGIVGVCEIKTQSQLTEKILLLDRIQDPGNMGTIIRSAIAFNYKTIVMEQCVDVYNAKVIRATQGAIFQVNIIEKPLKTFINQNSDYYYLATDLSSENYLKDISIKSKKIGLILGNEGSGIRSEIIELANSVVKIKINTMESLNVSIAGSILMYEINKGEK
ncbi:MAG: TrmH family RNA methyltransferase [Bacillota bacterium]